MQVLDLESDSADLKKEIDILARCHSPFIVAFRGTFEKDGQLWVRYALRSLLACSSLLCRCAAARVCTVRHANPAVGVAPGPVWLLLLRARGLSSCCDTVPQIAMEYCGGGSVCDVMSICEKTLTEQQVGGGDARKQSKQAARSNAALSHVLRAL